MYDNDPAVIDLKIQIDEQGAEKSVDRFISGLRGKLEQLRSMISNAKVSDDDRKILRERQEYLSSLVNEMGEFVKKTHEAGDTARGLNRQIREMGKVMKGQVVRGYENTTTEVFEQTKEAAREARAEYQKLNNELGSTENVTTLSAINAALNETAHKIAEMETALRHSKGVNAFEILKEDVEQTEEDLKRATLQAKAYAMALEKAKAVGRDKPTAFEVKQIEKRLIDEEKQSEEEKLRLQEEQEKATKKENAAHRQQIQALNEEKRRIKEGASQYYYRLRAIKMLDHVIRQADDSLNRFIKNSVKGVGKTTKLWFKLATPFGMVSEAIKKATDSLKTFNKESKKTTKSHDGFIDSMKHGIWTVIKYTLGIRSLYFLFRRLRSALSDGMKNLATQYDHVNQQMSSVVSSLERMKNAIAAMVQPLLNVLVPALEKISELFANLAYNVASFFATLTGQDFVHYAKKIKKGYIEDKKAAKDYNDEVDRQLSNLDKLNVLTSPKDKKKDEEESPVQDMFDVRPISAKAKNWLKKLKDFLKPIFDAWAKEGEFVKNAWKYAWEEIVKLAKDIWRDFLKVWFEPETTRVFENIFHIIGDIGLIVGNLAKNFRKAWNFDDNGYRILKAIRDIILVITERLREAADYTVKWSEKLNFIPMLTTLAGVLNNQIVPAVDKIMALLVKLYEEVFLELVRYVIEDLSPILIRVFGNLVETIGNLADNFRIAWQEAGLGRAIVQAVEDIITDVAKVIEDVSEKTKEWAANLNFRPLLRETYKFLVRIRPFVQRITEIVGKFWTDVLLPIGKDFIEKYLPKMLDTVGKILGKINLDQLSRTMDSLFGLIRTFWDKYGDVMLSVITQIADKLVELINSGTLEQAFQKATDFIGSLDPDKVADFVLEIGKIIAEVKLFTFFAGKLTGSLTGLWTVINFIKQSDMTRKLGQIASNTKLLQQNVDLLASGATKAESAAGLATKSFGELAMVAGSAIAIAASIALIIGMIVTLWNTNEEFKGAIIGMWDEIKSTFSSASEQILESLRSAGIEVYSLKDAWIEFCNFFEPTILSIAQTITIIIKASISGLGSLVQTIVGAFNLFLALLQAIRGTFKDLFTGDDSILQASRKQVVDALGQMGGGVQGLIASFYELKHPTSEISHILDAYKDISNETKDSQEKNSDSAKQLSDTYSSTQGDIKAYSDSMLNMSQNLDSASGSADVMSAALANMPSSMSPELAASIADMQSQLEEAGVSADSLGGNFENLGDDANILEGHFENLGNSFDNLEGNFANINVEGFTNAVGTQIPAATAGAETAMQGLQSTAAETSTALAQEGKNASDGFSEGIKAGFDILLPTLPGKFGLIVRIAKQVFDSNSPSKVFDSIGRDVVQGLANGIKSMINVAISAMRGVANSVISAARSALSASKLVTIGRNLLSGLANGIRSGISGAVNAIRSAANSVIGAARSAFQVHSPSKIFEDIGKMLDEGLAVGVDKGTDDVTDAFDNMVPDNQFLELFYEKFTGMLSSLREDSVSIVESMIDEIESAIARMDNLAMLESLSTQLSNISSIKIPDIAVGAKLPDNEKFAQTQTVDLSSLPKMLKSAFIEAFAETNSLQTSDSGDIIVEMNGYELLRAVRDENTKYKKQTGRSAFA